MVTEALNTAKATGAKNILCRGDSAFGNSKARHRGRPGRRPVLLRADQVPAGAPRDRHHPRRRVDPGALPRCRPGPRHRRVDLRRRGRRSRLHRVRRHAARDHRPADRAARVRDRNHPDELFPVWRYHPFFTNTTEPVTAADITHRQHAIIESVFADLIDGPLAHMPSGAFAANTAWATLAAITHNHPARRRDPHRPHPRRRPRGDAAPPSGQRPGPHRQTPGHTNPAPTSSLASSQALENLVGQHLHRSQSTRSGLTTDHRPGKALPGDNSGRAGKTSGWPTSPTSQPTQSHHQPHTMIN